MTLKQSKIDFLINFILIFFFPYMLFASVQTNISKSLQSYGFIVKEIGTIPIILPKSDISVKINNLSSLHKGLNKVRISFFYHNKFYANTDINIRLDQNEILPDTHEIDNSVVPLGKKVTMIYKTGNLIIRSDGTLLETKAVSSFVKVRNTKFNTVLVGVLIDPNTVLIP